MNVNEKVKQLYEGEFQDLLTYLRSIPREERREMYEKSTKVMFPKSSTVVTLESLLTSPRQDYEWKMKKTFLLCGTKFLSRYRLGCYSQRRFEKLCGMSNPRFIRMFMVSLHLMGVVRSLGCSYSLKGWGGKSHGYIYLLDRQKLRQWGFLLEDEFDGEDVDDDLGFDDEDDFITSYPETQDLPSEWLGTKQLRTMERLDVSPDHLLPIQERLSEVERRLEHLEERLWYVPEHLSLDDLMDYDPYSHSPCEWWMEWRSLKGEERELGWKLSSLRSLVFKTSGLQRMSVGEKSGRLFTVMTRIPSEVRHGGISLLGEEMVEVDMKSGQPTLLSMILLGRVKSSELSGYQVTKEVTDPDNLVTSKLKTHNFSSPWMEHCLRGDFYEWVMEVSGMDKISPWSLEWEMERLPFIYPERQTERIQQMILSGVDERKWKRQVVKMWMMRFLFQKKGPEWYVNRDENDYSTHIHRFFVRLSKYLQRHDPEMYRLLEELRGREENLSIHLQREETTYIKECLRELDDNVDYVYTVHDCLGCRQCDVETVKRTMEEVSRRMYGVVVPLGVE